LEEEEEAAEEEEGAGEDIGVIEWIDWMSSNQSTLTYISKDRENMRLHTDHAMSNHFEWDDSSDPHDTYVSKWPLDITNYAPLHFHSLIVLSQDYSACFVICFVRRLHVLFVSMHTDHAV
jgi:hypothetical protein